MKRIVNAQVPGLKVPGSGLKTEPVYLGNNIQKNTELTGSIGK
jgi:hypothetical protein